MARRAKNNDPTYQETSELAHFLVGTYQSCSTQGRTITYRLAYEIAEKLMAAGYRKQEHHLAERVARLEAWARGEPVQL